MYINLVCNYILNTTKSFFTFITKLKKKNISLIFVFFVLINKYTHIHIFFLKIKTKNHISLGSFFKIQNK